LWFIAVVVLVAVFLLPWTTNIADAAATAEAAEDTTNNTPPLIPRVLYVLDKDTRNDCIQRIQECQTSATDHRFFLQCPMTCATALAQPGGIGRTTKDPDEFFYPKLGVGMTIDGTEIAMEDLVDGYVTLFALIPMLHPDSGMSQYYYELLEHVAALYKYTLQIVVIPIRIFGHEPSTDSFIQPHALSSSSSHQSSSSSSSSPHHHHQEERRRRVIVLQDMTFQELPSFLTDFVWETKPVAGDSAPSMGNVVRDKVSMYLISADAAFVERLVSPTMTILEERIPVYINQLSARADL
jgi:hypothetical protein